MKWKWLIVPTLLGCGAAPASRCFVGVWQAPSLTCRTTCPGQPECAANDCALVSLFALNPDGGTVDVSVTTSNETKRMSSYGQVSHSAWRVEGQLLILGDREGQEWTCEGQSLTLGLSSLGKTEGWLVKAFERADSAGQWRDVSGE